MNKELFNFYCHKGTDNAGRTFDDILAFDKDNLESVHDYIQWLFPTLTVSKAQPDSPVLDEETIQILKQSRIFRIRFLMAFNKIMQFWEIPIDCSPIPTNNMNREGFGWLERNNHNQLRIARVLESSRLLGFQHLSLCLFEKLVKFCGSTASYKHQLTAQNLAYWYKAVSGLNFN